jgi:hypothetical protein
MVKLIINESNLQDLEQIKTAEAKSVSLSGVKITHETIDLIVNVLKDYGTTICELNLELLFPSKPYHHDLTGFDFVKCCPNLEVLKLKRCDINESVFHHNHLKQIKLEELWLNTGSVVNIGVAEDSAIEILEVHDSNWCNNERNSIKNLIIGPKSALKKLSYSLDEDYAECAAQTITINSSPVLEEIYASIHINWGLKFIGNIPSLKGIACHSGRYGSYSLDFEGVENGSSTYLQDLRDGKGPYAGETYVFLGSDGHFDIEKITETIKVLGGKVQETIDEHTTHVCLLDDFSNEWISEELTKKELIDLKEIIDNATDIEVIDDENIHDFFYDWY